MDDGQVGSVLRAIRIRRRLRQADVAALARVPREDVMAVEAGRIAGIRSGRVRAIAAALGATLVTEVRWNGADVDRILRPGHAAMHEALAALFATLPGWEHTAEVSFSIYGERGVIDILAWHAATRSLLIIELKTSLGDPNELVGTMDRRVRLGSRIAANQGWSPRTVSAWVIFADSRTNRRHVAQVAGLLRGRFSADGHRVRAWLRRPVGTIMGLSFWTDVADGDRIRATVAPRRVRPTRAERAGRAGLAGLPVDDHGGATLAGRLPAPAAPERRSTGRWPP